jgi:peptide/nickel transport system ATP-binding protein
MAKEGVVLDHGGALILDSVSVRYGGADGHLAVNDVSFQVNPGERVAVVGESGSGKSTLALAVGGFLVGSGATVSAARFSFGATDLGSLSGRTSPVAEKIPGISMVFQDAMSSLDPTWTIGSQLRAVLRSQGKTSRRALDGKATEWLERVRLTDPKRVLASRPYELSGGMRQRVMLALALCSRPRLLIADEPTSALDAALARATMDLLLELTDDTGAALLLVTHDIGLCREFTDRMLVMYHGRMVDQVPSRTADVAAQDPYTKGLLRCVPTLASVGTEILPTLGDFMHESRGEVA